MLVLSDSPAIKRALLSWWQLVQVRYSLLVQHTEKIFIQKKKIIVCSGLQEKKFPRHLSTNFHTGATGGRRRKIGKKYLCENRNSEICRGMPRKWVSWSQKDDIKNSEGLYNLFPLRYMTSGFRLSNVKRSKHCRFLYPPHYCRDWTSFSLYVYIYPCSLLAKVECTNNNNNLKKQMEINNCFGFSQLYAQPN